MADRPPGYEQAAEDLVCYNCGMKGHMFFACPEDTRRVPAGLEASRKRQASGNDYHVPAKRSKGPIVTHYPPPPPLGLPHIPPPPITYSPRPGYEGFHSGPSPGPSTGPPYHQNHHPGQYDQYPPPNAGRSVPRGLPYGNSRDVHEHHFQGPPRAPPPEMSYRPAHYDQYDRLGPSLAAPYGRPYSAPPDRYDEQPTSLPQGPPYTASHRTPHQALFEHYPPAPGIDNYYPGPPQPSPPPHVNTYRNASHYGYDATSPARLYTSGHGSPPPGTYSYPSHQYPSLDTPSYHARYDDRFADRPLYEPHRRDPHPQYPERHFSGSQQSRERHGRRIRYDSPKIRSRSERRFPDRPAGVPSPVNSTPPARSAKASPFLEGSRPQKQDCSDTVPVNMKGMEKYSAEEFSWEEEMIFKELPDKITRDLIREPLPAEWTDDPIMPPKYDKETITSRYINPTNVDDFALNVRETKAWQVMQYHPAFLPPTEIRIEKLWEYEKALNPGPAYNKQSRHNITSGGGSRQRGKSWDLRTREERQARYSRHRGQSHSSDDQLGYFRLGLTNRIWDQPSSRDDDEPEGENEVLDRKSKISSPEPGEVCESDDQGPTATKSPSPPPEREYHHIRQKYRHRSMDTSQDSRGRLLDVVFERDRRRSSPQAPVTPSLPPSHISRSPSRPLSTRSSQGGPSKPSSRRNSRSSLSPSSSRRGSTGSAGSPLTPNERELLGMRPYSSGSDTGPDSPIPQPNGTPARSRQRPAKLHAAYQRRW